MSDVPSDQDPIAPLRAALAGRYDIERELGKGAFATVYLAHDLRHDRRVAVKVLNVDARSGVPEMRFLREIRLLARLQHPNILPLHDSGHVLDLLYYVMPYVAGESLRDRLGRERRMEIAAATRIGREVADALAYAHRAGIVHRDIKPENILLSGAHPIVADFGIARVVDGARIRQLTQTGFGSPGTPAYMSPEQMLGGTELDARSDIYSLGCVLYEMLGGQAPFSGPSGFARRFTEDPPSVRLLRRDVPPHVDAAIRRAMARLPEERYATADELAEALAAVVPAAAAPPRPETASPEAALRVAAVSLPEVMPSPADSTKVGGRWRAIVPALRRRWWAAVPLMAILLVGMMLAPLHWGPTASADPSTSTYVVLPFVVDEGDERPLNGRRASLLLHDGLSRWRELRMVSTLLVNDALARRGSPRELADAVDLARDLGAGLLVWGELSQFQDTIEARAVLYDVRRRSPLRERTVRVPSSAGDLRHRFAVLADSLLVDRSSAAPASAASSGTRSLAAWRAYERAQDSLATWNVGGALHELRTSVALDPGFPQANLWLAQAMMWTGDAEDARNGWREAAAQAYAGRATLASSDAGLAEALHALASERYPAACALAHRLIADDSLAFSAWFLLGECHRLDQTVVRDARSPSGWSFRGSYHTAAEGYRRAFELVPSYHLALRDRALAPLQHVLFVSPTRYRPGVAEGADTLRFASRPALESDTIAFVPLPLSDVQAGRPGTLPARLPAALARNRTLLRAVAGRWVQAYPASVDARMLHASTLEAEGRIGGDAGALEEYRRARSMARDDALRRRLAIAEVRQLVRASEFAAAQALADSLLESGAAASAEDQAQLEGLAALTGRIEQVVRLRRAGAGHFAVHDARGALLTTSDGVAAEATSLLGYASFGAPLDSVQSTLERLERRLRADVPAATRPVLRQAILARPMSLLVPVLGASALEGLDPTQGILLPMQHALLRGDTAEFRRRYSALVTARAAVPPGSVSADFVLPEATLLVAVGDTSAAIARLDDALGALAAHPPTLLEHAPEAAGLVRAMALRAELAHRTGDPAAARRWGSAVATLWVDADPALRDVVSAMQAYAGTRTLR